MIVTAIFIATYGLHRVHLKCLYGVILIHIMMENDPSAVIKSSYVSYELSFTKAAYSPLFLRIKERHLSIKTCCNKMQLNRNGKCGRIPCFETTSTNILVPICLDKSCIHRHLTVIDEGTYRQTERHYANTPCN